MAEAKALTSDANSLFAWTMLHKLDLKGQNVFISPLSISLCIAMSGESENVVGFAANV